MGLGMLYNILYIYIGRYPVRTRLGDIMIIEFNFIYTVSICVLIFYIHFHGVVYLVNNFKYNVAYDIITEVPI